MSHLAISLVLLVRSNPHTHTARLNRWWVWRIWFSLLYSYWTSLFYVYQWGKNFLHWPNLYPPLKKQQQQTNIKQSKTGPLVYTGLINKGWQFVCFRPCYTSNPTGEKHTISTFVDQKLHIKSHSWKNTISTFVDQLIKSCTNIKPHRRKTYHINFCWSNPYSVFFKTSLPLLYTLFSFCSNKCCIYSVSKKCVHFGSLSWGTCVF